MYGTYISNQEFNLIRISVFHYMRNVNKVTHIKEVKNVYFA